MTEPTNEELAKALRSIKGLPLGLRLIVGLAADRLCAEAGDGWITWNGQIRPTIFKPGQVVETRHRNGEENVGANAWPWDLWYDATRDGLHGFWVHNGAGTNIIAYRVVGAP